MKKNKFKIYKNKKEKSTAKYLRKNIRHNCHTKEEALEYITKYQKKKGNPLPTSVNNSLIAFLKVMFGIFIILIIYLNS